MPRKPFPDVVHYKPHGHSDMTSLGFHACVPLEVNAAGDCTNLSLRDTPYHDIFVTTTHLHDMDCLLKPLDTAVLRQLAHSARVEYNGTVIVRPKRDDVLMYYTGGRARYIYNMDYLAGRLVAPEELEGVTRQFLDDLGQFGPHRPLVTKWSDRYLNRLVGSSHYDQLAGRWVPRTVQKAFYEAGRGGIQDTSVLGTEDNVLKVDRRMAYLWALNQQQITSPNLRRKRGWIIDQHYDPSDAHGCYVIDLWLNPDLPYSPVTQVERDGMLSVVGDIKGASVLKPTMDLLMDMERLGLARIKRIHRAYRFPETGIFPFRRLHDELWEARYKAGSAAGFIKTVATASWGKFLQTHHEPTDRTKRKWRVVGGRWYNPIVGYGVTDLIRATNYRMRLECQGMIQGEQTDALYGPPPNEDDEIWYDPELSVFAPDTTTHIGPTIHVRHSDDKHGLLPLIMQTPWVKSLRVPYKGRKTFKWFKHLTSDAGIREAFGQVDPDAGWTLTTGSQKLKFPADAEKMRLGDLLGHNVVGRPFTPEEAASREVDENLWYMVVGILMDEPRERIWELV